MNNVRSNVVVVRRLVTSFAALCACALTIPAYAQSESEDEADEGQIEEIVTTGSRIRRDTFSTTTPIQVLSTEAAERIGITSISELLQKSTAASGQAIDAGVSTNAGQTNASESPPDGGIGSSCINLRGLGCERTLVLVNGKRLGVSGIRGAPPQPDINAIPIGMVEAVDLLTGGLSTVYGADAVAGVVNVRLKRDFEGLTFVASTEQPDLEGGAIFQTSLTGGVSGDRGNITFGMEYSQQERVTVGDRDFSRCIRRGAQVQTESGEVISVCRSDFPDNWIITDGILFNQGYTEIGGGAGISPVDGDVFLYTPGTSNVLDPNGNLLTGYSTFSAVPDTIDPSINSFPSGGRPFYLDRFRYDPRFNDQYDRAQADLFRPYERFSLVMNGYTELDFGSNTEAYFEGYYFNRQNDVIAATEQIFPTVLGQVPLVDSSNNPILDANGAVQLVDNPLNPFPVDASPIVTLDDIPQTFKTELQQSRLVVGLQGDLPMANSWGYDVSASYDRATGFVAQPIFLENNLFFATQSVGVTAEGDVLCGPRVSADVNGQFSFPTCTPVDFFAASIPGDGITSSGRFATQAERDYLVQNRTNRTVTEMTSIQAYLNGDLFDISGGGTVATAFGVEYRLDKIDSQNSAIGVLGLNAAENPLQEGETRGERTTFDVYGELSAPLVVDADWANMFQIDLAARFTDDENFGSEFVYKVGALWDINDYLSASTSFNTSFRAPNLREQFLADQAGALPGSADPCNEANFRLAEPSPALDRLIANCAQSGADITLLGTNFSVAIPTSTGGAAGLNPETSESLTATISASQFWTEDYDLSVALTYFDITIDDTVRALDPGTIVNRCFNDQPNLASPFCERVERNRPTAPADQNFISFVRAGFVNTGEETVSGFDLNTRFNIEVGRANVNWTTQSTFLSERLSQEFPPSEADPNGSAIVDNVGRIGNPELTFQSTVAVSISDWDVIWQARWFDETEFAEGAPNPVITDTDGNIIGGQFNGQNPADVFEEFTDYGFFNSSQFVSSLGPLRGVTSAESQMHHDLSATYNMDNMQVSFGINNVTDEEPSLIDQAAGPNRNNAVTSARYDLIGRSYFVRFVSSF